MYVTYSYSHSNSIALAPTDKADAITSEFRGSYFSGHVLRVVEHCFHHRGVHIDSFTKRTPLTSY